MHLDTILSWCPRLVNSRAREDLRAQPGAADLVHRGAGGADGVAADDGGPPAQQLLRHAPAGARSSRGGCWAWTRCRSASVRSSIRGGSVPYLYGSQPAPLHRGSLRPARRSARSRTATPTNASPAGSTAPRGHARRRGLHERVRRRHLGRLEAAPRRTATRCRSRRPSGAALTTRAPPHLRRAVAARDAAAAGLLPRRDADLPAREQRPVAGLRAPRSRHRRARRVAGRRTAAGRPRRRPTAAALVFQRRQLHPPRLAHLGQRPPQLGRHLPLRPRAPVGPAADARLPRARARRLARRHAGRVRRRQRRAAAPARASFRSSGGAPRVLAPDAPGLAYTPAFSPDGRLIAYSRWKPGGFRDIHLYDLDAPAPIAR